MFYRLIIIICHEVFRGLCSIPYTMILKVHENVECNLILFCWATLSKLLLVVHKALIQYWPHLSEDVPLKGRNEIRFEYIHQKNADA